MRNRRVPDGIEKKDLPLIAGSPLFSGIDMTEVEEILDQCKARIVLASNRQILVHEGKPFDSVAVVLSGRLRVSMCDVLVDGAEHMLFLLAPGEVFGCSTLAIGAQVNEMTLTAMEASRVLFLNAKMIQSWWVSFTYPVFLRNLNLALARRMRFCQQKLGMLHNHGTGSRLRFYYLQGDLGLTPSELAAFLGVNRTALHRVLRSLKKEGSVGVSTEK